MDIMRVEVTSRRGRRVNSRREGGVKFIAQVEGGLIRAGRVNSAQVEVIRAGRRGNSRRDQPCPCFPS
jgi:hypothetical protein